MSEKTKLEQVEEAVEQMTQLLREMHGATKDAKQVLKEVEESKKELAIVLVGIVNEVANGRIEELLEKKLDDITEEIIKQKEELYRQVDKEFEGYMNVLRYGNKQGRGRNALEEAAYRKFRRKK